MADIYRAEGGAPRGDEVLYVKAVGLYHGDHAALAWHNKALKPQLKGNIWRNGLYVSQKVREEKREIHTERDDGLTEERNRARGHKQKAAART